MPLVPEQSILYADGISFARAQASLQKQMDDMPALKIVSISLASIAVANFRLVAVVETV